MRQLTSARDSSQNDYLIVLVGVVLLTATIGALLYPYALNTWLGFFGRAPVVTWWHGAILGAIWPTNKLTLFVAAATWAFLG